MGQKTQNTAFRCGSCGLHVVPTTDGSYRNHCPSCLWSLHVDVQPGDRASPCRGAMEPTGLRWHARKGPQVVHTCVVCGHRQANRVARDTVQPDDLDRVLALPPG
jgi:predicted RNA-binding Zn-ribbon protein involved in translation (DUF1610 family)